MNRSIAADFIKSISIFGVVFIHGSYLLGNVSDFEKYTSDLFRFSVPSFIIIWAYFFEKSYQKKDTYERKKYILNKFFHLFTIFSIWSLLYFLILVDWETLNLKTLLTKHFSGYGWSGQYFFIILFQLLLLFPLIRLLYYKKLIIFLIITLIFMLYVYWGYFYDTLPDFIQKIGNRPFYFWIIYVFVGIYLNNHNKKQSNFILALAVFLIPIEFYFQNYFGFESDKYIMPSVLIGSIMFCVTLLQYDFKIKSKRIVNIITYIGNNTMTIFVANPMVIIILGLIIPKNVFPEATIWMIFLPFLSSFLVLGICLMLSLMIKKLRLNGILN